MERCGSSFPAAIITEVYQKMTGKFIKWHHEISREMCVNSKLEFPKGWVSVYNIDPNDVREGFDKVIVLSRNLETIKRVFWFYYKPEVPFEEGLKTEKGFFAEIEKYYELVYGKKVNNSKFFYISLEDINNYTVDVFNQLLDFLGFPKNTYKEILNELEKHIDKLNKYQILEFLKKYNGCVAQIVPVNPPERNWQCFSDEYPRGFEVNDRLKMIEYRYALNQSEAQLQLEALKNKIGDDTIKRNNEKGMRYEYGISPTPYKLSPLEKKVQENKSFRINLDLKIPDAIYQFKVVVIGSAGNRLNCHPCENLHDSFNKIGFSYFITNEDLRAKMTKEEYQEYYIRKKPIKLSSIQLNFIPDFIFIDEGDLHFKNDINIPVVYYHKYLHRPLSVKNATIVLFEHDVYQKYYEQFVSHYELSKTRLNSYMFPAVNPEIYKPQIKIYGGVYGIGYRRNFDKWFQAKEIAKIPHIEKMQQEIKEFKKLGFKYFESPISDEEYRKIVAECDAIWFPIARNQYITQRMLEAMACKTMCIFTLEDADHERILKEMGYINGKHYIGIKNLSEIKKMYSIEERAPIIQEAYKITLRNHSYNKRARSLYDLYNIYLRPTKYQKISKTLDLGCGTAKTPDSFGVDIVKLDGVDLVYDLNKIPYPFENESFETIVMNDIIEHLKEPPMVIKECYRLLKKNGELRIKVVYFAHRYAWGDPTHIHAFSEVYFEFFCKKTRRRDYYYDFAFDDIKINFIHDKDKDKIQAMEVILTK